MATKRAMIVGINKYHDEGIKDLQGAEKDAEEIKNILEEEGDFEVKKEHYLLGELATRDAVQGGISDLFWAMSDPCDVTLFFFSGHGFQDSYGTGYIAPWDMDKQRPLVRGVEMQELRRLALNSANKGPVVLIFDCCYAGVAADAQGRGGWEVLDTADKCFSDIERPEGMVDIKKGEGMADIPSGEVKPTGVFVFSSSASDQTSRESLQCHHKLGGIEPAHPHGLFSFQLLEGLAGEALREEGGLISVDALRKYLNEALRKNPGQTFKSYAANETRPEAIFLARASNLERLNTDLGSIKNLLESRVQLDHILAAIQFLPIEEKQPDHPSVTELRKGLLEPKLSHCRQKAIRWFIDNNVALFQQRCPRELISRLDDLVCNLCLDRIREEVAAMHSLLSTVVEAADQNTGPGKLVLKLCACEDLLAGRDRQSESRLRGKP